MSHNRRSSNDSDGNQSLDVNIGSSYADYPKSNDPGLFTKEGILMHLLNVSPFVSLNERKSIHNNEQNYEQNLYPDKIVPSDEYIDIPLHNDQVDEDEEEKPSICDISSKSQKSDKTEVEEVEINEKNNAAHYSGLFCCCIALNRILKKLMPCLSQKNQVRISDQNMFKQPLLVNEDEEYPSFNDNDALKELKAELELSPPSVRRQSRS